MRSTLFVNDTDDRNIKIEYGTDDVYLLEPKSAVNVHWNTADFTQGEATLPQFRLEGVELDQDISLQVLYENLEITIFRRVNNAYSFRTFADRSRKGGFLANEGCRFTLFGNLSNKEIRIEYDNQKFTLKPGGVVPVRWHTFDRRRTLLPKFCVGEIPELESNIFLQASLYDSRGIIIFADANDDYYSLGTTSDLPTSKDMDHISLIAPLIKESGFCWTRFYNKTDSKIQIEYNHRHGQYEYKLSAMSVLFLPWFTYDAHKPSLSVMRLKGVVMDHKISCHDLEVIIFRDVDDASCIRALSDSDCFRTEKVIEDILRRMENLLNKVSIWRNQCEHLLKKYREGVRMMLGVSHKMTEGGMSLIARYAPLVKFICSMLEGEALLHLCSGSESYNKAAFALSLPLPSKPTCSKFALLLRELDWTMDFQRFLLEASLVHYNLDEGISLDDNWDWSEERCRLVFFKSGVLSDHDVSEDGGLEGDWLRQAHDREHLLASLKLKPTSTDVVSSRHSSPVTYNYFNTKVTSWSPRSYFRRVFEHKDELEAIWRKRLRGETEDSGYEAGMHDAGMHVEYVPSTPPHIPGLPSRPVLDSFWIDNPNPKFHLIEYLGGGNSKIVHKVTWLGETAAVATFLEANPKFALEQLADEAGILARLQNPYVVELMGCAYSQDEQKAYLVTELMDQDLDSLITKQLKSLRLVGTSSGRPPFIFRVAIDIALQIAEAMIYLHSHRVIHRDLKPKNILVSPRYPEKSLPPGLSDIPVYHTVKLIDFGISKVSNQGSLCHTHDKGTAFYMAPEVYGKNPNCSYSYPADVYSFGMTCYEIFTGKLPYKEETARGQHVALKDVKEFIRGGGRPSFPDGFPSLLKDLLQRCWAHDPIDRPKFDEVCKILWRLKLRAWWDVIPHGQLTT